LIDLFRPSVGFAAVSLLERAGCQVRIPLDQTCCGQPTFNSGDFEGTREIAKQVITLFADFDYVVGASGSCMGTIKKHYPELFSGVPEWLDKAEDLARRSYELVSFLHDVMGVREMNARYSGVVTYHDSCSGLREMQIKDQPRTLLRCVEGLTFEEMQDSEVCCGFGGTFCVKYPEISERMVTDKVGNIEATGADTLLGGDLGCLLNIAGRLTRLGTPVRVLHVAEVLAGMGEAAAIAQGASDS
jgi:L-lactate dehydrogenase complex protein LldE